MTRKRSYRSEEPRIDRVAEAVKTILDRWEQGLIPASIAETWITKQADDDRPSSKWSFANRLLMILNGTQDARGFRQWQQVGRTVKKGAKAFYITAPLTRKVTVKDEETGEEEERVIVYGFRGIPVFRYEDTDGDPLPEPDYSPPELPPLYEVAERLGVPVKYAPRAGNCRGLYRYGPDRRQGEIVLFTHETRVFFHELAHAAHHRIEPEAFNRSTGQDPYLELVAETVAATLCYLYHIDGYEGNSYEYIKHYAAGKDPAKAVLPLLGTIEKVLDMILLHAEEDTEATTTETATVA